jgi:hypothetical protein
MPSQLIARTPNTIRGAIATLSAFGHFPCRTPVLTIRIVQAGALPTTQPALQDGEPLNVRCLTLTTGTLSASTV